MNIPLSSPLCYWGNRRETFSYSWHNLQIYLPLHPPVCVPSPMWECPTSVTKDQLIPPQKRGPHPRSSFQEPGSYDLIFPSSTQACSPILKNKTAILNSSAVLRKVTMQPAHDPATVLLGIHPKDIKTVHIKHKETTHACMSITAVFIIAKN